MQTYENFMRLQQRQALEKDENISNQFNPWMTSPSKNNEFLAFSVRKTSLAKSFLPRAMNDISQI